MKAHHRIRQATIWLLFLYFTCGSPYTWADQFEPIVPGLQLSGEVVDGVATDIQFAQLAQKASEEALKNQRLASHFDQNFRATGAYGELHNGALASDWDNLAKAFGLSVTTLLGAYALWQQRKKTEIQVLSSGDSQQIDQWFASNLDLQATLKNTDPNHIVLKSGKVISTAQGWSDETKTKGLGLFGSAFWSLALLWKKRKKAEQQNGPTSNQWGESDWHRDMEALFDKSLENGNTDWREFYRDTHQRYTDLQKAETAAIEAKHPKLVAPVFDQKAQEIKDLEKTASKKEQALFKRFSQNISQKERIEIFLKVAEIQAQVYILLSRKPSHRFKWRQNAQYFHSARNYASTVQSQARQYRAIIGEKSYQDFMDRTNQIWKKAKEKADYAEQAQHKFETQTAAYQKELNEQNQLKYAELESINQKYNQIRNYKWQYWQHARQRTLDNRNFDKLTQTFQQQFSIQADKKEAQKRADFQAHLTQILEQFSWEDLQALKKEETPQTPFDPIKFTAFMAEYEDLKKETEAQREKEKNNRWKLDHWNRKAEYPPILHKLKTLEIKLKSLQPQFEDYQKREFGLYNQVNLTPDLDVLFSEDNSQIKKAFIPRAKELYQAHLNRVAQKHRVVQFTNQLEHLGKDNPYFALGHKHLPQIIELNNQIAKLQQNLNKDHSTKDRYQLEDQVTALKQQKATLLQDLQNLKAIADGLSDIDFIDEPVIEDWESAQSSYYQRLLEKDPVYQFLQAREKKKAFFTQYAKPATDYDFVAMAEKAEHHMKHGYNSADIRHLSVEGEKTLDPTGDYQAYRAKKLPKKVIWYTANNRAGKGYARIDDYKDKHWDHLWMMYHYWKGIPGGSINAQKYKDQIEAHRDKLTSQRGKVWEEKNPIDLTDHFSSEQLEAHKTLQEALIQIQKQETVELEKEKVIHISAQTIGNTSVKTKLKPVSVAKEIQKPLEVALKEDGYTAFSKVFSIEIDDAAAGALTGALAALNPPTEPEIPDGSQEYRTLINDTDQARQDLESQDKSLRNTVIRRQKLESEIKHLKTKAMNHYDNWRRWDHNKDYNLFLRYNAQLREAQNTLKELLDHEAAERTTLHETQARFNNLQERLGREKTRFARYDNLLTTYNQERTTYEAKKAAITKSVSEKYAYLRSKAKVYFEAHQKAKDKPITEIVEADIIADQKVTVIPAREEVVKEKYQVPKDLYELKNLVASSGDGILMGEWKAGEENVITKNHWEDRHWVESMVDLILSGKIEAIDLATSPKSELQRLIEAVEKKSLFFFSQSNSFRKSFIESAKKIIDGRTIGEKLVDEIRRFTDPGVKEIKEIRESISYGAAVSSKVAQAALAVSGSISILKAISKDETMKPDEKLEKMAEASSQLQSAIEHLGTAFREAGLHDRIPESVKRWHFEDRIAKNTDLPTYEEANNPDNDWTEVPQDKSLFHIDNRPSNPEIKFTNTDGREAVYDGETKEIVTNPRFMGTFNYGPMMTEDQFNQNFDYKGYIRSALNHTLLDILPYFILGGNTR